MITLIVLVLLNFLLIGFALPLAMRKVKPNPTYGFHAKRTCSDPKLWYPVNAFAGKALAFGGVLCAFLTVFMYVRNPAMESRQLGFLGMAVMTLLLTVILVASFIKEAVLRKRLRR